MNECKCRSHLNAASGRYTLTVSFREAASHICTYCRKQKCIRTSEERMLNALKWKNKLLKTEKNKRRVHNDALYHSCRSFRIKQATELPKCPLCHCHGCGDLSY